MIDAVNCLNELDFEFVEKNQDLYSFTATKVTSYEQEIQIPYNSYNVSMKWHDGNEYLFIYYVFEDGSTMMSSNAPNEINPLATRDTTWIIDLDTECLTNTSTEEMIRLVVAEGESGKAVSPGMSHTNTITTEKKITTNTDAYGNLISLYYESNGHCTSIEILYDVAVERPETPISVGSMDNTLLQADMMIVSSLDTVILP